jgi:hypothetical protein
MTPEGQQPINAASLKERKAQVAQQEADYIAGLRAQRATIDAELVELGAKRIRKPRTVPAKSKGRPAGSRNKPKVDGPALPVGTNAATEAGL